MAEARDEILVATVPRNTREVIRVTRETYQGHDLVQARVWYRNEAGELCPGKGISMKAHLASDVADALSRAVKARPIAD